MTGTENPGLGRVTEIRGQEGPAAWNLRDGLRKGTEVPGQMLLRG